MKASLPRTSFIHLLRKSSRESSVYTTLSHAHRLRVQVSCSLCASWAVMRILQVCPVSGPWLVLSLLLLNCCHFVQGKTWCPCHILGPRSTGCTCCRAKGAGSKGAYSISRVKNHSTGCTDFPTHWAPHFRNLPIFVSSSWKAKSGVLV